jgi:DNA topoisomerase-1
VPEEFWEVDANVTTPGGDALPLQVSHQNDKPFRPENRDQTMAAVALLEKARYQVLEREDKPTSSKPGAPFITSTLQQAASTRLGYGVKKTMMMAQRLYEAGYITYMRTDSTNLSQDAVNMVRGYISDNFGKKYLPESANQFASKENSQEAHEAIRPSDVSVLAESLKDMEADAQKLYQLIWRQFVACQMTPAQYDSTTLTVGAGDFRLKARGRILRFDGWTKVMPALRKGDEDRTLPAVNKGDELSLVDLIRHSTSPSRLRASVKRHWLKSWKNAVLAVRRPTRQLSRPFRIVVTSALKTVVSMRKKWVRSSPTVWKPTSAS